MEAAWQCATVIADRENLTVLGILLLAPVFLVALAFMGERAVVAIDQARAVRRIREADASIRESEAESARERVRALRLVVREYERSGDGASVVLMQEVLRQQAPAITDLGKTLVGNIGVTFPKP